MIPLSWRKEAVCEISKKDTPVLTGHHLIRMTLESAGGRCRLSDLYGMLA